MSFPQPKLAAATDVKKKFRRSVRAPASRGEPDAEGRVTLRCLLPCPCIHPPATLRVPT